MKKKYFITLFLLLTSTLYPQSSDSKWERFSGIWKINDSLAYETLGGTKVWNYYDLLDHNTIISSKDFQNYSTISVDANLLEKTDSLAEFMISFAVRSESKSWYYQTYAFKITGGFWGINKAAFIQTDRLDKSKPLGTKNNTVVKELASANCKVKYNKKYNYIVSFENKDVVFYVDGQKILSAPFPEKSYEGRIAISSRNVKIAVDKVVIKQSDKVIFEDDFNENSIYVRTLKATKEKIPKTEIDK